MAQLPLKVTSTDDDHLTLQISKSNFSEFVSSLLSTPREEKRKIYDGFDLTLNELKILVDKIHHKINTDHDVLSLNFGSVAYYTNQTEVSTHDYNQFFSTTDIHGDDIDKISITISAVIGLNRPEGEKLFEKQIISFSYSSGHPGTIESEIRSTELSWPASYFAIIKKHTSDLRVKLNRNDYHFLKPFLYLSNIFYRETSSKQLNEPATREQKRKITWLLAQTIGMSFAIVFISATLDLSPAPYIVNPETGLLEKVNASDLVSEIGAESAASTLTQASVLHTFNGLEYEDGSAPLKILAKLKNVLFGKVAILTFTVVTSYVLACWFFARYLETNRMGRIFLHYGIIPARKSQNHIFGALTSVFLGIWTSLLAAALFQFVSVAN